MEKTNTEKNCCRGMEDDAPNNSNVGNIAIVRSQLLVFSRPEMQLVQLLGGFGCTPDSRGNACYCKFIDGSETRLERYDFVGIANKNATQDYKKFAEEFKNKTGYVYLHNKLIELTKAKSDLDNDLNRIFENSNIEIDVSNITASVETEINKIQNNLLKICDSEYAEFVSKTEEAIEKMRIITRESDNNIMLCPEV